jgi:hypothetical protein
MLVPKRKTEGFGIKRPEDGMEDIHCIQALYCRRFISSGRLFPPAFLL